MSDFRRLTVWQRARVLRNTVFRLSSRWAPAEHHELISQIRRAARSVPANISEACGYGGGGLFGRYLRVAIASASELQNHWIEATDLGLVDGRTSRAVLKEIEEVRMMIYGLIGWSNRTKEMGPRDSKQDPQPANAATDSTDADQ